jgi:hypothetical protein
MLTAPVQQLSTRRREQVSHLLRLSLASTDSFLISYAGRLLEEIIKDDALMLCELAVLDKDSLDEFYTACGMSKVISGEWYVVGWRKVERI